MLAHRLKGEPNLVPDVIANGPRDADPARLREGLEPRCDVDAIAIDVVLVEDDVAEIDPDPDLGVHSVDLGPADRSDRGR